MKTTEIFQKLHTCRVLVYEKNDFKALLDQFAPKLLNKYLAPYDGKLVYVWRDGEDVLYVGKSTNWKYRLISHLVCMLGQTTTMYKHFFLAHEAGTLTVELHICEGDIDKMEEEMVLKHSTNKMYNIQYNPNKLYYVTPHFTTIEEMRAFIAQGVVMEWESDPEYIAMKDRLTPNGSRQPFGRCVYCSEVLGFRKLIKHELKCIYKLSSEVLTELKTDYKTASSKTRFINENKVKYDVGPTQLTEFLNEL